MNAAVVGQSGTGPFHEIVSTTDEGNLVTRCEMLLMGSHTAITHNTEFYCTRCIQAHSPAATVVVPTVKQRKKKSGIHVRKKVNRPQWRPSKTIQQNAQENLQFANREIIAAIEWNNRGDSGQFRDNMLDRAALAYRFLGEVLVSFGRKPTEPGDVIDD